MNRALRVLREKSSCSFWLDFSAASLGAGLPKASIEIDASPERKTPILFVTMYARPGSGFLRLTLRSREKDVVQNQPVAG